MSTAHLHVARVLLLGWLIASYGCDTRSRPGPGPEEQDAALAPDAGSQDAEQVPDQGGQVADLGVGRDLGEQDAGPLPGARVELAAQLVEHCPIDPPAMAGRARLTPTGARVGLDRVELLRTRSDPSPVRLPLSDAPVEVDLTGPGLLGAGEIPAGTYEYLRLSLAYATVSFPATGHLPGYPPLRGTLTLELTTADHAREGLRRATGRLEATFTAYGRTSAYLTSVPNINCPLSDSGGIVNTNGGKHTITVPLPGGPLRVVAGGPLQVRTGTFPMAGAVVWEDREQAGFEAGIYDIDGAVYDRSEVASLLPMCNLLLTDRCEADVEPPRHLPAWPMPDSSSATFSTGQALVAACPAPGEPGHGQDACYTTRPPAYTIEETTVRDLVTDLLWQRQAPAETYDWWDAVRYCGELNLGGRDDWRLPTRLELESILDVGRANPSIDLRAFPDDRKDLFWTSSPVLFSSLAYGIRFDEGYVYDHDPYTTGAVRCVAGGVPGPARRFELSGELATDRATGLMWQRAAIPAADWVSVLRACEDSTVGGHTDWRVPSIKEFYTIVEDTALAPCIDIEAFPGNTQEAYWTSTPGALEAVNFAAWVVNFNDCYTTPAAVTQLSRTRCVRDVD